MKLKTQIKIYQKLLSKLGRKYDGAEDFISSMVKQLCLEHGILEEVRLYIFLCCVYSLVINAVKNESFLHQNSFALKCRAYKKVKQKIFLLRCIEAE